MPQTLQVILTSQRIPPVRHPVKAPERIEESFIYRLRYLSLDLEIIFWAANSLTQVRLTHLRVRKQRRCLVAQRD
jgi:hypothetical protein